MPRFTAIHSKIWRDDTFNQLSDQGKLFFLYILSSPHSNMIGLYLLPQQYISHDLSWSMDTVNVVKKELVDLRLVKFDEHDIVYIPTFLKHNPVRNVSQMKGAVNTLTNLPETTFRKKILEALSQSVDLAKDNVKSAMEGALSGPLSPLGETSSKRINNKESKIKNKGSRDPQKLREYNKVINEKFEEFWKAYPRKEDKKRGRSRFESLFPLDMDKEKRQNRLKHIVLHLNQYVGEVSEREKQFIKLPATWLNSVDFDVPPDPEPDRKSQWSDTP